MSGAAQVLDDSCRKALPLPIDRFAVNFSLAEHDIMPVVQELLMPDAPSTAARLHKLNVYGPGGFFKMHQVGIAHFVKSVSRKAGMKGIHSA